jgi:2-polyprenyl-3-methyl-5-hydroxy-6-metoxy-1,4-benzoquinol methylase
MRSGLDYLSFIRQGYDVVSIDASNAMVEAASKLTGQPALLMRSEEMNFDADFDGIWACASLLHVPRREMPAVFDRFERALKPSGVWFMSFKAGHDEVFREGRLFTNFTEQMLRMLIESRAALEALRLWTTMDARKNHSGEQWTNVLIRRRP